MRLSVSSSGDGYMCGMRLFQMRRQGWRTQDGHSAGASNSDARSKCRRQQQHKNDKQRGDREYTQQVKTSNYESGGSIQPEHYSTSTNQLVMVP